MEATQLINIMQTIATTKTGKHKVVLCSSFVTDNQVLALHDDHSSNDHSLRVRVRVEKGKKYHFGFISTLMSSVHHDDPEN